MEVKIRELNGLGYLGTISPIFNRSKLTMSQRYVNYQEKYKNFMPKYKNLTLINRDKS